MPDVHSLVNEFVIKLKKRKIERSKATAKLTAELLRSFISQQRLPHSNEVVALIDVVKAVGADRIAANPVVSGSDLGDLWCDDGSSCDDSIKKSTLPSDMDREWQRRRNQFHTIGYRDGLIAGTETSAQEGFNIGFRESVLIGYNWGLVRGITSAMAFLPDELKEKLVETDETRTKFQDLHKSVHSLSTTDALKLFYEGQQRKSGNQNENAKSSSNIADLNNQNPDVNVLQNYYGELESLISESRLVDVYLKTNQ